MSYESGAVALSEPAALALRALGAAGDEWLAGLPGLLAGLASDWSITVGARLDGGRAAYVAEATTADGTPAVLKVSIPEQAGEYDRQLAALQLAGGDPYAGLIRHDRARRALLLERLGRPLADLGEPSAYQMEVLTRTAARGWRPVGDPGRLPTGADAARWHADSIPARWAELARPCSAAAVEMAVRIALARETAFDPGRAVLVHGDVHARNTLRGSGPDFRLVDPLGLISEPEHDLGVIQARGVSGWSAALAAGDPGTVLAEVTASCRVAARTTGTDPEAVWQWAYVELVSTGLHLLRLGDHEAAGPLLTIADKLARRPARLWLMVGLPGSGKTTRAAELAATHQALRLTPDEWMIPLYDGIQPDGKRDVLEGRLITVALQALRAGTSVVLDFGLWSRDERSALRRLATAAGAACEVVYLPVDPAVQQARVGHRQATAAATTFPMSDADLVLWRGQFEEPDAAELDGGDIPGAPPEWAGWAEWAVDRWPSLEPGPAPV